MHRTKKEKLGKRWKWKSINTKEGKCRKLKKELKRGLDEQCIEMEKLKEEEDMVYNMRKGNKYMRRKERAGECRKQEEEEMDKT